MIDPGHSRLSIVRQCELVSISRSAFYRELAAESEETLRLMRLIDEQFLETPWYGSRQMARHLRRNGWCVGRHRVRRLMTKMGLAPIYQHPKTSEPHPRHKIHPYLLRHLTIDRPNQVWCADVTYIPMRRGFLYLVAIMDWASRKVLAWRLSNTMDAEFCVAALEEARAALSRTDSLHDDHALDKRHVFDGIERGRRTVLGAQRTSAAAAPPPGRRCRRASVARFRRRQGRMVEGRRPGTCDLASARHAQATARSPHYLAQAGGPRARVRGSRKYLGPQNRAKNIFLYAGFDQMPPSEVAS
jgi:HTH-like domain/Integrase core domain